MKNFFDRIRQNVLLMGTIWLAISSPGFAVSNPSEIGDLIARDLNIAGLGWAGHIAMWSVDIGGSRTLEVLNESPVIQTNTLVNFKSRSPYWHARYGKGTLVGRTRAIAFGWYQSLFSPKYTTTAAYKEGKIIEQRVCIPNPLGPCVWAIRPVIQLAQYRCDTFVYLSYKKNAGITLSTSLLPRNVFYGMPKQR